MIVPMPASRQEIIDAMKNYFGDENPIIPEVQAGELYFEPWHLSARPGKIILYNPENGSDHATIKTYKITHEKCQRQVNRVLNLFSITLHQV